MKENIQGEFHPAQKSKHRVTVIAISHTKPINQRKITSFLRKLAGGTVKVLTYKNAVLADKPFEG